MERHQEEDVGWGQTLAYPTGAWAFDPSRVGAFSQTFSGASGGGYLSGPLLMLMALMTCGTLVTVFMLQVDTLLTVDMPQRHPAVAATSIAVEEMSFSSLLP